MFQGFLLGLANGTVCLASCSPVLVPFLLGEGQGIRKNCRTLALFLSGRLAGYLAFSIPAWLTHRVLAARNAPKNLVVGAVYLCPALPDNARFSDRIEDAIDYDGDGTSDYRVTWPKGMQMAQLTPLSPSVTGIEGIYHLKDSFSVRVNLRHE